ncbi:MAG: hypothetical protein SFU84_10940 [Gemmatimonadales bacterium]|nr:hypothetical protein [Gemmatimonadales bacterium]
MQTVVAIALGAVLFVIAGVLQQRGCNGRCAGCAGSCARHEGEGDHHAH